MAKMGRKEFENLRAFITGGEQVHDDAPQFTGTPTGPATREEGMTRTIVIEVQTAGEPTQRTQVPVTDNMTATDLLVAVADLVIRNFEVVDPMDEEDWGMCTQPTTTGLGPFRPAVRMGDRVFVDPTQYPSEDEALRVASRIAAGADARAVAHMVTAGLIEEGQP